MEKFFWDKELFATAREFWTPDAFQKYLEETIPRTESGGIHEIFSSPLCSVTPYSIDDIPFHWMRLQQNGEFG